jgi:hypothetical protein
MEERDATLVVGRTVLLLVLDSPSLAATVELAVKVPPTVVRATTVTVAEAGAATVVFAMSPRAVTTVPFEPGGGVVCVPCVVVAETKVIPAGRAVLRTTPVAADGPSFLTTIVYVTLSPSSSGSGESVMEKESSTLGLTAVS